MRNKTANDLKLTRRRVGTRNGTVLKGADRRIIGCSQTCLGAFSLLCIKVIRSIIHWAICHITVCLTLQLPEESVWKAQARVKPWMKQQEKWGNRKITSLPFCFSALLSNFVTHIECFCYFVLQSVRGMLIRSLLFFFACLLVFFCSFRINMI